MHNFSFFLRFYNHLDYRIVIKFITRPFVNSYLSFKFKMILTFQSLNMYNSIISLRTFFKRARGTILSNIPKSNKESDI